MYLSTWNKLFYLIPLTDRLPKLCRDGAGAVDEAGYGRPGVDRGASVRGALRASGGKPHQGAHRSSRLSRVKIRL